MHNPLNRSIIAEAEWSQESSRSAAAISAAPADHSRVDRQPRQDWDDESGGGQPRRTSHFWAARPPSDGRPARSGNFVQRLTVSAPRHGAKYFARYRSEARGA